LPILNRTLLSRAIYEYISKRKRKRKRNGDGRCSRSGRDERL